MWVRHFLAVIRRLGSQIPGLLVLAALGGLMIWGHHHKWKVPHFVELWGNTTELPAPPPTTEVVPVATGDTLYRIRLASESAVAKVGIVAKPLQERPLTHYITANGVIDYDQSVYADVSPRAGGTVWAVFKKEGDEVEQGEVLALVASPDVVKAKAELLQALLQVEARDRTVQRLKATADVIAERQLRDAERDLREARIRVFEQQQSLTNLGLPVHAEEMLGAAEHKVVARLRTAGIPEKAIRGMDRSTLPNSLLPLYAPLRGQVIKRDCTVGELVTPADVQFIVADTRRLWILLDVRLEDSDLLALGQEIIFRPDVSSAAVAHGQISWIRPGVDAKTRTVRVRANVENPDGALRPNTFGTGRIVVRPSHPGLGVPAAAIQRDGDLQMVFVQVGDTEFEGRRVEIGARDGDFAEVRSGLRRGDTVVVAGSHVLKSEIVRSRLAGAQ